MNCKFNKNGDCKLVIPIICGDKCAYGELLEEYTVLKQTYDACYNEHMKVVQQNKQLQAEYNRLLEETRLTS